MDPKQRYREIMTAKGRRISAQNSAIVEFVFALTGTFDEEGLLARMPGQVSRATVYRTIACLLEADLLRRVEFNGRQVLVATADPDSAGAA